LNLVESLGLTSLFRQTCGGAASNGYDRLKLAALRRLVENRWIKPDNEVVIFNTASGLKYLDVIQRNLQ